MTVKHKTKGKWQIYVPQLYMVTKRINLFQIYLIFAEGSLEDFYSSGTCTCTGIHPQLFPLLLTKALMR